MTKCVGIIKDEFNGPIDPEKRESLSSGKRLPPHGSAKMPDERIFMFLPKLDSIWIWIMDKFNPKAKSNKRNKITAQKKLPYH
ncbi:MAG: hypothetical protein R2757_13490 [Draconibacterium sp.]